MVVYFVCFCFILCIIYSYCYVYAFFFIYVPFYVLCFIVLFYVLFVCKCVFYCCHRVCTQLQSTNISYHKSLRIVLLCSSVKRIPKRGLVTVGCFSTFYFDILQTYADWIGVTLGQIMIFLSLLHK